MEATVIHSNNCITSPMTKKKIKRKNDYLAFGLYLEIIQGLFIIFSVIKNIYNKTNKGPTLMELFTTTGKLKKFFLTRYVRCVHHG
jgi:hypothetical protein